MRDREAFPDEVWDEALRHCGLIKMIALRYLGRDLEVDDLMQEGLIGVCRAVVHYDPGRGAAFATCAGYWIRDAFNTALVNGGTLICVPLRARHYMRQSARGDRLTAVRECSVRAAAAALDGRFSLDDRDEYEIAGGTDPHDVLAEADEAEARPTQVRRLLGCLDDRHRAAIVAYYGLDGRGERTYPQVAAELGIYRMTASELCRKAICQMREMAG